MRKVTLCSMHIENFKGLRLFDISFNDVRTDIIGANGVGKTTLHDAYLWLLTGADSSGNSAFNVQPLDIDNKTVPHLVTSVTCVFSFDGIIHEIKRTYEQKWTRRKGTKEDALTGNTSEYFIDNVPLKAGEFSIEISKLFCKSEDFALISSVRAFDSLDTKTKRSKLIQMAGQLPEIVNETDYPHLWKYWVKVGDAESIKRTITFEMNVLKEKKAAIPTKITENERDLPEGIDFDAIRAEIAEKKEAIERIDAELQKSANGKAGAYAKVTKLSAELRELESDLSDIADSTRANLSKKRDELLRDESKWKLAESRAEAEIKIAENLVKSLSGQLESLNASLEATRDEWSKKNAETFSDTTSDECPTCHHKFTDDEKAEIRNSLVKAFNEGKVGVLKVIVAKGNGLVARIKETKGLIDSKNNEMDSLRQTLDDAKKESQTVAQKLYTLPTLEQLLAINKEYALLQDKKHALQASINEAAPTEAVEERELKNKKYYLSSQVEELIKKLALEGNIDKVAKRRAELESEDAELSAKIADLDGVLWDIQRYSKAKINLVEDAVSSKFKIVRWKMYEPNITNDGEREICECLVNGVPVSRNVNQAAKVNAGIDIINALSKWLDISVPLWVDQKESVTHLLDTDEQLITLQVVDSAELKVA